jgi:hypothetical protein
MAPVGLARGILVKLQLQLALSETTSVGLCHYVRSVRKLRCAQFCCDEVSWMADYAAS